MKQQQQHSPPPPHRRCLRRAPGPSGKAQPGSWLPPLWKAPWQGRKARLPSAVAQSCQGTFSSGLRWLGPAKVAPRPPRPRGWLGAPPMQAAEGHP